MVKRRKALKGAKGSALFMVICIMAILMVVAITAMAMVSLAYTRSLQNYTASQSYVTAVNTLDMISEVTHYKGAGSSVTDYGQDATDIDDIAEPLRNVLLTCMADTTKGGQVEYGTIEFDTTEMSGIQFVDFTDQASGTTLGQIKYQVLKPSDPSAKMDHIIDGDNASPSCNYGSHVEYNGRYYTYAKVKVSIQVQSGSGDTAQVRTVSKVIAPVMSWEETSSPPPQTPPTQPGGGLFDQAVKALGKYTSAPGVKVIGGISTKETTAVNFPGLDEITKSMYINGDMNTVDSGWSGDIKIGAGKQITVNGTLTVGNNFKMLSTFDPDSSDGGSKPFIYCENIQWTNSNIPSGDIDIITETGGVYGRDNNEISGNVLSGGDLELVGNNLKISGTVFVDGDVEIKNGLSDGGGTIYYTGSISGNLGGVKAIKVNAADYNLDIHSPGTNEENGQNIVHFPDNSREYNIMTESSVFSSCYDESGNIIKSDSDTSLTSDPATGTFTVTDEDGKAIPAEDIVVIDATTSGTIEIDPGKTIVFDTSKGDYFSDFEVVVKSGEGIVNVVQTPGDITLKGVKMWSETVKEAVEKGEDLDPDAIASNPEYSKIFWDVPSGANITMDSQDPGNLLNAYIYSPEANFSASTQDCGVNVKYEGNTSKVWLLGSVIANDIDMGNGLGIIFIDPYANSSNGGNGGNGGNSDPPPASPATKTNFEYDVLNGNFYYTNRG